MGMKNERCDVKKPLEEGNFRASLEVPKQSCFGCDVPVPWFATPFSVILQAQNDFKNPGNVLSFS